MKTYYVVLNEDKTKIEILSAVKRGIMYSIQLDRTTYSQLLKNINGYTLSNVTIDGTDITFFAIKPV